MGDKGLFDCSTAQTVSLGLIIAGIPVGIILLFIPAWYGRYGDRKRMYLGSLPAKVAWMLQECPFVSYSLYLSCDEFVCNEGSLGKYCLSSILPISLLLSVTEFVFHPI